MRYEDLEPGDFELFLERDKFYEDSRYTEIVSLVETALFLLKDLTKNTDKDIIEEIRDNLEEVLNV